MITENIPIKTCLPGGYTIASTAYMSTPSWQQQQACHSVGFRQSAEKNEPAAVADNLWLCA